MPHTTNQEWRNFNRNRDYPFSAGVSRVPDTGIQIPEDAFIDAVFYPINLSGVLYLSRIDRAEGILEISDDESVKGTGQIGTTDTVYFVDDQSRPVGTIVLGPGFDNLSSVTISAVEATRFSAGCVFPQNQVGVRALKLPDGTLVTGDITIAGEDGIEVVTTVEDGKTVIRFQAVGVQSTDDCIDLPPPCRCLKIKQTEDSTLTLSQSEGTAGVVLQLGARLELEDVCPEKNIPDEDGNLPLSHGDFCEEEPPQPSPEPPDPGFEGECPTSHNGRYFIIPMVDLLMVNPSNEPADTGTPLEGASIDGFQDILDRLPPRDAQALEIMVRGY